MIRWAESAADDLVEAVSFIRLDSPEAASSVASRIVAAVESLAALPAQGKPGRVAGTRELRLVDLPYVIVYAATGTGDIDVIRVLHTRRAWPPA
ncbi:MAG TPA: type II toxin-antitoxin system mRNA interferase toxin, RelE/StbE family [Desulfovibrio sp.]|nr:type II toxin-antitoxin system mRNA interferase toxin, RelE/StbE family [Desulfovibrio sp.]